MMNFMNPHAILVHADNVDEILDVVPITRTELLSLIDDSHIEDMRYYIVGWRDTVTGMPTFKSYTEVQLACEYRLGNVNPFWHHFTKI